MADKSKPTPSQTDPNPKPPSSLPPRLPKNLTQSLKPKTKGSSSTSLVEKSKKILEMKRQKAKKAKESSLSSELDVDKVPSSLRRARYEVESIQREENREAREKDDLDRIVRTLTFDQGNDHDDVVEVPLVRKTRDQGKATEADASDSQPAPLQIASREDSGEEPPAAREETREMFLEVVEIGERLPATTKQAKDAKASGRRKTTASRDKKLFGTLKASPVSTRITMSATKEKEVVPAIVVTEPRQTRAKRAAQIGVNIDLAPLIACH